ncbi:MAG: NUDIX domain-containing protein [Nanoarchaeota archaeon]
MKTAKSCGAVIFRRNGVTEFLVIKAKEAGGGHWDFPKGHVEEGESERQTAEREIYEEVGLKVRFIDPFRTSIQYVSHVDGVQKTVVFFLAEAVTKDVKYIFDEVDDHIWLPFDEALVRLTHENAKRVLRDAQVFLRSV